MGITVASLWRNSPSNIRSRVDFTPVVSFDSLASSVTVPLKSIASDSIT